MTDLRSLASAIAVPTMTLRARGAAGPDVVWARYAAPQAWPSWSPQISRVETDAPRIRAGAAGKVHGPLGARVLFDIEEVDEAARTWSWRVRVGPVALRLWHSVEARGEGSATTLTVRGPLPVVAGYAPLAQLALCRLVRP